MADNHDHDEDYPANGVCGRCGDDNGKGGTPLWCDLCEDCDAWNDDGDDEEEDVGEGEEECVFCGDEVGFGNNPSPVCEKGRACDSCNRIIVIPARMGFAPPKCSHVGCEAIGCYPEGGGESWWCRPHLVAVVSARRVAEAIAGAGFA